MSLQENNNQSNSPVENDSSKAIKEFVQEISMESIVKMEKKFSEELDLIDLLDSKDDDILILMEP